MYNYIKLYMHMCIYKVPPGEGGWRYPCGKMDRTSKESLDEGVQSERFTSKAGGDGKGDSGAWSLRDSCDVEFQVFLGHWRADEDSENADMRCHLLSIPQTLPQSCVCDP